MKQVLAYVKLYKRVIVCEHTLAQKFHNKLNWQMRCQHKAHCNLPIVYHNAWPESKFGKSVIIRRGKPDNTN